jgi:hypothetical protein
LDVHRAFERFAGACAIAVGAGGVGYAIAFIILLQTAPRGAEYLSNLFLLVGGLLTTPVVVAIYRRLQQTNPAVALWGLLLGIAGALGSTMHGAYHLANLFNPPDVDLGNLPTPNDPRGILTFAVTAVAIAIVSWLILQGGAFPKQLGQLGFLLALLLLVIYVGRLTVYDPKNPVLYAAALLAGLIVNPVWYVWLGLTLRKPPP